MVVFGDGGGGGYQNVTCSNVDSAYLQSEIVDEFERLYFYSGKDTDNRFFTKDPPYFATIGRSGYTNDS